MSGKSEGFLAHTWGDLSFIGKLFAVALVVACVNLSCTICSYVFSDFSDDVVEISYESEKLPSPEDTLLDESNIGFMIEEINSIEAETGEEIE